LASARPEGVFEVIRRQVAAHLGIASDERRESRFVEDLGMTSLTAVELPIDFEEHQAEHDFAMAAATSSARSVHRFRYWPYQWAHGPEWVTYNPVEGERWFGFEGVGEPEGLADIALVPLPGHSPGHSGVAIRVGAIGGGAGSGPQWLLHAADAYFDHREIDPVAPRSTPGLAAFQNWFQFDASARRNNRARLRELAAAHGDLLEMFCSHDTVEFGRYRDGQSSPAGESSPAPREAG